MGIPVKLEVFEGPLDLLLHLIEKNKIDIYDIPIVEITDQYMEYIHAMEREDLGVMSEFMVMAATLLDIKCKMLLPKEVNEEGEEEDPRAELVEKLLEYTCPIRNCFRCSFELWDILSQSQVCSRTLVFHGLLFHFVSKSFLTRQQFLSQIGRASCRERV